jgi:hypothetical protein
MSNLVQCVWPVGHGRSALRKPFREHLRVRPDLARRRVKDARDSLRERRGFSLECHLEEPRLAHVVPNAITVHVSSSTSAAINPAKQNLPIW